jgi:hypothetical protein
LYISWYSWRFSCRVGLARAMSIEGAERRFAAQIGLKVKELMYLFFCKSTSVR